MSTFVSSPLDSSSANISNQPQTQPLQQSQMNTGHIQPPLNSPTPDNNAENVKKMERFLLMLISLARQKGKPTHMLMQYLVQNLLLG
ncbi:hypothetical protein, partial [Salmonella sp. s51228]|uniref:hypothetical protein n=1 Tax=Salmonella sp. s51228 TaxID=3159652 RepID=UPI003980CE34